MLLISLAVAIVVMSGTSHAQYWFQSGVSSGTEASNNNGAAITIQTVSPQNVSYGSFGFWIGELLSNGAFVQAGYLIPNSTGYRPTTCNPTSCSGQTLLQKGIPSWFWEYFPTGYMGSDFFGGVGPNGSAGANGTNNQYSFFSTGNTWHFQINGQELGNVNLGTSSSGSNYPVAIAEYADATDGNAHMTPVLFQNMMFYKNGQFMLVPTGYSDVSYGQGSQSQIPNPYGVSEVNNRLNYFEVGSGVQTQSGQLWNLGFQLTVNSKYGNVNSTGNYSAYKQVTIIMPTTVAISNGTRAVFLGWTGTGSGSYTGNSPIAQVTMSGNINEQADWAIQYYLNVSSSYGSPTGSGWYAPNSVVQVSLNTSNVSISQGAKEVFSGWNATHPSSFSLKLASPSTVVANWQLFYLVNATSPYQTVLGGGWRPAGSVADLTLSNYTYYTSNDTRFIFTSWSNGYTSRSVNLADTAAPITVSAIFAKQYLLNVNALDNYSRKINVTSLTINGGQYRPSTFLFAGNSYNITAATYKNVSMPVRYNLVVNGPQSASLRLPVYNVTVRTRSYFGTSINATLNVTFYNGTSTILYAGDSGERLFTDVPYGYVIGNAGYFYNRQNISVKGGDSETIMMITPSLIIAAAGAIVLELGCLAYSGRRGRDPAVSAMWTRSRIQGNDYGRKKLEGRARHGRHQQARHSAIDEASGGGTGGEDDAEGRLDQGSKALEAPRGRRALRARFRRRRQGQHSTPGGGLRGCGLHLPHRLGTVLLQPELR